MKNKFVIAILFFVFGYKNITAQISQSTIKPVINKTIVNTHQYSVTLSPDSTNRSIHKFLSVIDSNLNISCNLEITGMPNDTAMVILQLFERNSRSSAFPGMASKTGQPVIIVLNNEGYAHFNLNKDNRVFSNPNRGEQQLSLQLSNAIQSQVKLGYIGASLYKLGTRVIFGNKNLQDRTLESSIFF